MFILPWGLSGRLGIIPFASILVIVFTCWYSIQDFSSHFKAVRDQVQWNAKYPVREKYNALMLDMCKKELPQAQTRCSVFENVSGTGAPAPGHEQNLFDSLNDVQWFKNTIKRIDAGVDPELFKNTLYIDYRNTLAGYEKERLQRAREEDQFMRGNVSLLTSSKALALHGGWGHLLGNMLILISFAFYLEKRVGALFFIVIYYLGGLAGNFLQVPFLQKAVPLVGASGCVSAVIGAFAYFFWRERMRILVSFMFIANRVVLVSAALYISLFFVASDIVGLAEQSQIAHLAHLGGFFAGVLLAALHGEMFPVAPFFIFKQEHKLYQRAQREMDVAKRLALFRLIARENPDSFFAFSQLFEWLRRNQIHFSSLGIEDRDFIKKVISDAVSTSSAHSQGVRYRVLKEIPKFWDLNAMDLKFNILEMRKNIDNLSKSGSLEICTRLESVMTSQEQVKYVAG